jgi:tetratricopeptide (TPR) repeat protein
VPPLDKPSTVLDVRIDASKGIEVPAATHGEALFRGDAGWVLNASLANLAPAQRDAALRRFWTQMDAILTAETVSTRFDPATRELRLVMDGTAAMTWDPGNNGWRVFFVRGAAPLSGQPDFGRQPGPHADAPFAVAYPAYSDTLVTVILPNKGQGFRIQGTDMNQKVAGRLFTRTARIEKGVFKADTASQSLTQEFPASEVPAATDTIREMAKNLVYIAAPANYRMTSDDLAYYEKKPLTTAKDLLKRGDTLRQRGLMALARADLERALALDPATPGLSAALVQVDAAMGDFTAAGDALKKGLALKPDDLALMRAAGYLAMTEARYDDAVAEFGKVLAKEPNDRYAHRQRAIAYQNLNNPDKAVADLDALLQVNAKDADARQLKVAALLQAGKGEAALSEADAGLALEPKSIPAHLLKGDTFRSLRRDPDAQGEYDIALGLDPTANGHLVRGGRRVVGDHQSRLKDTEDALKLDPDNTVAQADHAAEEAQTGRVDKAIADINDVVAKNPNDEGPRQVRAFIYTRAGKLDLAAADLDWLRAHVEDTGAAWNTLCHDQGIWNLSLEKALADCDKGVSLAPRNAAVIDSRALVLLRLGRTDDAITAYDLALKLAPREADSLYGRGLAEVRKGQGSQASADFAAARVLRPHVDDVFAEYGLKAPAAYASSNSATK